MTSFPPFVSCAMICVLDSILLNLHCLSVVRLDTLYEMVDDFVNHKQAQVNECSAGGGGLGVEGFSACR